MFGTPNTRPVGSSACEALPRTEVFGKPNSGVIRSLPTGLTHSFCGQLLDRVGAPATKQNGRPGRRRPKFKPKRGDAAEPSPTAKPSSFAQRQATTPDLRHVDGFRHGTVM